MQASKVGPNLAFRPDVDGLRALAVVAVVLFHAEVPGFTGGFVGVDVFFVISGFLITQRVVSSVEADSFSFASFYARRARRLLPAAATTALATLVAGIVLLPPDAVVRLARSAVAAALSISNVLFWSEAGYWDTAATSKPLLHTWSLGVEEQFYVLWPVLLVALLTWRGRRAIAPLLGLGAISLAATVWFTGVDASGAFYLMPFRFHEFVLGAALVWLDPLVWPRSTGAQTLRLGLWSAGLGAMLVAIVTFDGDTVFPGVAALLPSVGAAMVIAARRPVSVDGFLSNPVTSAIGLRSYSIYLAHWPLLVFAGILAPEDRTATAAALVLTAVFAEAQYRMVERPSRWPGSRIPSPGSRPWGRVAAPAVAAMAIVAMTGIVAVAQDGAFGPQRTRDLPTLTFEAETEDRQVDLAEVCRRGRFKSVASVSGCGVLSTSDPNVLVLGDSHTADAVTILHHATPEVNVLTIHRQACPPVLELGDLQDTQDCKAFNASRFALVDTMINDLDAIVVTMLLEGADERLMTRLIALEETVAWMTATWSVPVIVLGVGPFYEQPATTLGSRATNRAELDAAIDAGVRRRVFTTDDRLASSIEASGATYLPKLDVLCPADRCPAIVPGTSRWMIPDRHHLTRPAALLLADGIRGALREALGLATGRG